MLTFVNNLVKCDSIVIADGNISEVILLATGSRPTLTFVTSDFNIGISASTTS